MLRIPGEIDEVKLRATNRFGAALLRGDVHSEHAVRARRRLVHRSLRGATKWD